MRKAMIQRATLVPYIYTQAYTAHKTGAYNFEKFEISLFLYRSEHTTSNVL